VTESWVIRPPGCRGQADKARTVGGFEDGGVSTGLYNQWLIFPR